MRQFPAGVRHSLGDSLRRAERSPHRSRGKTTLARSVIRLVELGEREAIFRRPLHSCPHILLQAIPLPDPDRPPRRISLTGDVPNPIDPPPSCPFHPRCPLAIDWCREEAPVFRELEKNHWISCHRAEEVREIAHAT